jgi:ABC-2 type transport system permease protein
MVFAISEFLFRGFDLFDQLIIKGELDVLFLRPRGMVLQILGHKIEFGKLGRVFFSLAVLIYVILTTQIAWTFLKLATIVLMIISGVVIFLGVFMLSSSVTIFTIRGNEFVNIFTNGGKELTEYPLDIYKKFFTKFFTFFVPFACFNYLPLHFILSKPSASILINMLSPIYGMLFIIPCYFIFKWALTKYTSTGT